MTRNINFVRERQRKLSQLEIQDRRVFRIVAISFVGVLCAVAVTLGARFFFLYKVNKLTEDQKAMRNSIASKESIEKSFTVFSYKLRTLTDLFGKRKEKQEALAYFSTLFGPDVSIRQLSYSGEDEMLHFTLEAKSVFVLDEVLIKMSSPEVKEKYPTIQKESLQRGKNAKYSMAVTIALGTQELTQADEQPEADAEPAAPEESQQ